MGVCASCGVCNACHRVVVSPSLTLNPPFTQAPLKILQIKQSPSWKFRLFIIEFALLNFIVAYIIKVLLVGCSGRSPCSATVKCLVNCFHCLNCRCTCWKLSGTGNC